MIRFILGFLLLTITFSLQAQQTKTLTAEKHNEYGLVYNLPVTSFKIDIVAVKETKKAGPFYKYAQKFAGTSKVITEDLTTWTIESVKITPFGVAAPEKSYLMQLKAGATTYIGVGEDGMLLSINKEPKLQPSDISYNLTGDGQPTTGNEYLEFVNEDFISAQSSFKKAQLLGEELMEIREAKTSLTRGTAESMPTDGRQLELMLQSLDKQEKALIQAFTGNSWKERTLRSYIFTPNAEGQTIVARFSDFNGAVDADDYSGDPVYAVLTIIEKPSIPVDSKGEEKKLPKDAVIYKIPSTVNLSLSYKGKTLTQGDFRISQFGMNFGLSPSIFTDKKEPSYAVFDPTNGAVMEIGSLNNK